MARLLNSLFSAGTAFVNVFKQSYRISEANPSPKSLHDRDGFNSYQARLSRYSLYWAFYENTAYDAHPFSPSFKSENSLYRYTRGVMNPVNRLVEVNATQLMGGALDIKAGDGEKVASALPILTDHEDIRPAIARLWKDSIWQSNKTMFTRLGVCLGDVGLKICDDPVNGKVRLDVVHPATIRWLRRDVYGNVKSCVIEEWRLNPDYDPNTDDGSSQPPTCLFTEQCFRDGDKVIIRTFKDGIEYDWDKAGAVRELDYGFAPLVVVNHLKVSPRDQWGWAEPHAGLTKFAEADDLASKLDDQIRKAVEGVWFITNAQPPRRTTDGKITTSPSTEDELEPGRQEMRIIYGGNGGTAVPLLFPLDIQFTTLQLRFLEEVFEKDYPELQFDSSRVSGDASAKALREVKKKATQKIRDRRTIYDEALVRAQQMALSVGGHRKYEGYEPFDLNSFRSGDLDHMIGNRSVFETDALDEIEEWDAFWGAAEKAFRAGCPLETYLRNAGWNEAKINAYLADQAKADKRAADLAVKSQPPKVGGSVVGKETGPGASVNGG